MDYLYHYTSVESLALILKNKSFRLSPLSTLDDLQEERVKDSQRFGEYVFVSSWTEDEEELVIYNYQKILVDIIWFFQPETH